MKHLLVLFIWFPLILFTLGISLSFYSHRSSLLKQEKIRKITNYGIQLYSSFPKVLSFSTKADNDQSYEKIFGYLAEYDSPMMDSRKKLIEISQQYDIDPFLLIAIAQCESNLGIRTPEGCYNPFGLGFYGGKRICFSNWEESYEFMAKTLRKNYLDNGLKSTNEIMQKYNPYSVKEKDGHWAKCVDQFIREIDNYGVDF